MYKSAFYTPLAAVLISFSPSSVTGQNPDPDLPEEWVVTAEQTLAAENAPLWLSDEPLELTIEADFRTIRREDRNDDAPRRDGKLTIQVDGAPLTLDLKLQTRGEFRRNDDNCSFPPLWLDFDKDDELLTGTPFEGQNRVKLYVTCRSGQDRYEQYILHEYLLYPIHNLITDVSFRARLANVTYVDETGEDDTFTNYAFLLEDVDDVAARHGAVELEPTQVHPVMFDDDQAALSEVFAYMIGMTDFSIVYSHNSKVLRKMAGDLMPVVYDFDVSGIINTRYAAPDPSLGIRSVKQRVFRGFCREAVDYPALFQRFIDQKEEIWRLHEEMTLLDDGRREDSIEYLEEFFETVEDPGRAEDRIIDECRDMPRTGR